MTIKTTASVVMGGLAFAAGTAYATGDISFDFDNFMPTLDKYYALQDGNPQKTFINSGYNLTFSKGTAAEHDFVFYTVGSDHGTITPVYYKISYDLNRSDRLGPDYTKQEIHEGSDGTYRGYFKGIQTFIRYYRTNPDSIPSENSGALPHAGALHNKGGAMAGYEDILKKQPSTIDRIEADFINNAKIVESDYYNAYGGALGNTDTFGYYMGGSTIVSVIGDFIGNYAENTGAGQAAGGAIANAIGEIGEISGVFVQNYSKALDGGSRGGAIVNIKGTIGIINGVFVGNYAESTNAEARGGAFHNSDGYIRWDPDDLEDTGKTAESGISGVFVGNYASGKTLGAGGAISNDSEENLPKITGTFNGNYAISDTKALGGAIYAISGVDSITGSFINNYAESKNGEAHGGAIYVGKDTELVANGLKNFYVGNYTLDQNGKIYNAIYVDNGGDKPALLVFDLTKGGDLYFNDNITGKPNSEGVAYGMMIKGHGDGRYFMNNYIAAAGDVTVDNAKLIFNNKAPYKDDASCGVGGCKGEFVVALNGNKIDRTSTPVTNLFINNGEFNLYNDYTEVVRLKNYTATGNALLHIDVMRENNQWVADKIYVADQIYGVTQVVVYDKTNVDNRNAYVMFIEAPNDYLKEAPNVFRSYGSPYKWTIKWNYLGEPAESGNYWYLVGTDIPNEDAGFVPPPESIDDPDIPEVTPEVGSFVGLPVAGLEQTRGMIGNVHRQVDAGREFCPGCGFYDHNWDGKPLKNLWVNAVYHRSTIDSPLDIDSDVWGIEAGGDMQYDVRNRLGLFVSYRQGKYDLNGKGKYFYSTVGSEIDIDSYIIGLYYRYTRNQFWTFATIYGGLQQADIRTDDGVKADTDGIELGGSVEVGYDYIWNDVTYLTPSAGLFYTQVDYDDAKDNVGKKATYSTIRRLEAEAGLKLTRAFRKEEGFANVYIRPSVIRPLTTGDKTEITGFGKVKTVKDETLGRIEVGGHYSITDSLSTYGWANYTFGSHYEATNFGVGLSYSW